MRKRDARLIEVNFEGDLCSVARGLQITLPDEVQKNIRGQKMRFNGSFRPITAGKVVLGDSDSVREFLKNSQGSGETLEPIETAEEFLALIASAKRDGKTLPETIVVKSEQRGKMLFYNDGQLRLISACTIHPGASIATKVIKTATAKARSSSKKTKKVRKAA